LHWKSEKREKNMHAVDVGQQFIRYYAGHGFQVLPRGSLLDPAVPMTFVGSAGLTQIESEIDEGRDHAGKRYVLVQPCFRHFDLEKVGKSPVHLSLFEMGGAFSFGQTDREDTLGKIWDFLTNELGLRPERLWATYFAGGDLDGHEFGPDEDTFDTWRKIGLPSSRLVGVGTKLGLWKQGGGLSDKERLRKCAPTTELFFDRDPQGCCGPSCQPGCKCGRFIEISNVLFIHFQIDMETKSLQSLSTPFDETVIGVERVALALLEKPSVFDLPGFAPLVRTVLSFPRAADFLEPSEQTGSAQVIADHIRALLFLTADGAPPPGKGGRRRIMRKLVRNIVAHKKVLGITEVSFIPSLIDAALDLYQPQYSYLAAARKPMLTHFSTEKRHFERTLAAGHRQIDRYLKHEGNGHITGQQALVLVKRHGIPFALLEAILARRGIELDEEEYWEAYTQWRRSLPEAA
jgi:alanyl-tRNA synthetase